jgi:hypothetical protein
MLMIQGVENLDYLKLIADSLGFDLIMKSIKKLFRSYFKENFEISK